MAEGPAEDLDALVRRVDPDRWLASRFIADAEKRADVIALYAFDHELRRAVEGTSNPIMAEIRLTWWSEALDEIYEGRPVRRHPVADALQLVARRRNLPRAVLQELLEARAGREQADPAVAEAAGLALDPGADREAIRLALAGRREAAGRISASAFPAVAHLVLSGAGGELSRRARLTWAVLTGRL